ncbi:hypothetical protein HK104_006901, partial [Borealophlyctis nickersoniae]
DGRAKAWNLRKGQYQVTETAWEAVHRVSENMSAEKLAVSESVVAWIDDAGVVVRRAADGATVGKPFSVRTHSKCDGSIPHEVALTRTHLIAHTHLDMGIYVYSLSNLELVHHFQYGNPDIGLFQYGNPDIGLFQYGNPDIGYRLIPACDHHLRVSDSGSAIWGGMQLYAHVSPSPHYFLLVDMPNCRIAEWGQELLEDSSPGPAIWVWYRKKHRDGEGGDREDEECVWMSVSDH